MTLRTLTTDTSVGSGSSGTQVPMMMPMTALITHHTPRSSALLLVYAQPSPTLFPRQKSLNSHFFWSFHTFLHSIFNVTLITAKQLVKHPSIFTIRIRLFFRGEVLVKKLFLLSLQKWLAWENSKNNFLYVFQKQNMHIAIFLG